MDRRSVARPASLIFTLYGDFVHRDGDRLSVASLVRLMAEFGLSEQAVRQAVSRMSRQGWLRPVKSGTRAAYALTGRGIRRVEQISPRIYEPATEWDGQWRIVTYTVSESARAHRDQLRKDLTLLGLAPLSGSTWISPRDVVDAVRDAIQHDTLAQSVHFFAAAYLAPLSDRELLEKCWDLHAIAAAYRVFITYYEPRLEEERKRRALSDEAAFVERLWLVQDFRRFAYLDPGLPSALLPAHWPGSIASALFREYYALVQTKADRFYHFGAPARPAHLSGEMKEL